MKKSTSPLPAIDRRSLVCGLGTATVAGVPALAGTASKSDDPVFHAIAALEKLIIHAEEQEAAYEIAEAAVFRARLAGKEAEVEQRVGYREIEGRHDFAIDAVWEAQTKVMEAKPVTPAGAITLLRFVAELLENEVLGDEEEDHCAMAMRNVADFFEGSASVPV